MGRLRARTERAGAGHAAGVARVLRAHLLERRVVARLAAAHVVRLHGLADPLEHGESAEDLKLARSGHGVPLVGRRGERGEVRIGEARCRVLGQRAALQVPREGDAVRLHTEANERGHRDTAVLDLSVAKPADGGRVALVPEVGAREAERVPEPAPSRVPPIRQQCMGLVRRGMMARTPSGSAGLRRALRGP